MQNRIFTAFALYFVSQAIFAYSFKVDNLCYNILSSDERTCSVVHPDTPYSGNIVIPSYVRSQGIDYKVTEISKSAFSGSYYDGSLSSKKSNPKLLSVTIPNSIDKIDNYAFMGCTNLLTITIPNSVTSIGVRAFDSCNSLKEVTLEDGTTSISFLCGETNYRGNFAYCPLVKIYIGRDISLIYNGYDNSNGLTYRSNGPFSWQDNLIDVTISDTVSEIPSYLFYYDQSLSNIIIGNNVKDIDNSAFQGCSSLKNVITGKELEKIYTNAFSGTSSDLRIFLFTNKLKSVDCPSTVTFYTLNTSLYSDLLSNYTIKKMFGDVDYEKEYTGKACEISLENNTGFGIKKLNLPINAGVYPSVAAQLDIFGKDLNVDIPCNIKILPANVIVLANDCSRKFGVPNPNFTYEALGLKNNETTTVFAVAPDIYTSANEQSIPGTYAIIPFGAEAQNYTFTYERGTLTITKADQVIEWEQEFGNVSVGDEVELTATSSAGLPIKYSTTDETIADIFTRNGKKYVEFLKPGTVSIRANQEGNENYNEADRVSKSVKVGMFVSGITLSETALTLNEGSSAQLTATVTPAEATNKAVTWESSNPKVATVDANGKVTAVEQGSATITVKSTDGTNVSAQCEVTVVKLVSGISLNVASATLNEGQSLQLEATVLPASANNKSLVWSSSDEMVATVSQDGKVVAKSKGTAVIIVKSADGSDMSATCNIDVKRLISELTLNKTSIVLAEGESDQIIASVTPESANNKTLVWSSSDESVAVVNQDGKVTALSKGVAVISAKTTDGSDVSASCSVNVVRLVSDIDLDLESVELHPGENVTLIAKAIPADASNTNLVWGSSDSSIALVNNGVVTAVKIGAAIISVSTCDGSGIIKQCKVNVTELDALNELIGNSTYVADVYTLQGRLILHNATRKEIEALTPGIYIIKSNGKTMKIKI